MPNLIFILVDGLRNDRLTICHELIHLASDSYFFPNHITAAPYTLGSMFSIFSSIYPSKNGVDGYRAFLKFKKEKIKTLTQYVKDAGYYTVAEVCHEIIPKQGFDVYNIYGESEDLSERHVHLVRKMCKEKNPFFLYLHYIRIHDEVVKTVGKKYTDFDKEYFENYEINKTSYNSYAKKADEYLKKVLDEIKKSNLLEDAILVVASDHGVSNGERIGEKMYGSFLYDYTTKTFLILKVPGASSKKIPVQVRSIDIMPTILELLNIREDPKYMQMQGKSLSLCINGVENKDRIGLNLPKGSSIDTEVFAKKLLSIMDKDKLNELAKLHFKTYKKIRSSR